MYLQILSVVMHVYRYTCTRHMFVSWYFINLFLMINYECKHYSSF